MSIFSFGKKESMSLLVNIGNGGISVALVGFAKNQLPKVIYSTSSEFKSEKSETTRLPSDAIELLDSLIKNTFDNSYSNVNWKNKSKNISNVVLSFSSPWVISKSKVIHLSKEKPFIVSKKFIENIIYEEEKLYKKELRENPDIGNSNEFITADKSVVHAKINGYFIDNCIEMKTDNLDLFLYMSVITKNIEDSVNSVIAKHINISPDKVIVNSAVFGLFSVMRDIFPTDSNYLFMNIDSEITDLVHVENHTIEALTTFPFGENSIIRQIAKSSNQPFETAKSQFSMFITNKSDSSIVPETEIAFQNSEKEWAVYLEDALSALSSNNDILPRRMYLFSKDDITPVFSDLLKQEKNDTTHNFRKNLDIIDIPDSLFSSYYEKFFAGGVDRQMSILVIFCNRIFN